MIDSGINVTAEGVPLWVWYHWDTESDTCEAYEVFLDGREETDLYDLLKDAIHDKIYEAVCNDIRRRYG